MRFRTTLLPLLAAALLGACTATAVGSAASSAQAPTPQPSAGASKLDGRTFVSKDIQGRTLVKSSSITLSFKNGQLGAQAGCNTMSGQYTIKADGTLDIGQMATTEMGCEQSLMDQDAWFATFLSGAKVTLADTTLTLSKGDITITLVDKQTTNLPLGGTTWMLNGMITGDTASSVPQGVTATLVFQDGKVMVDTGCNTGSGTATTTDTTITFGATALTKKACTTWAGAVEAQMVAVLQGAQPYTISGDTLTIGGSGKNGLMLKGTNAPASTNEPTPSARGSLAPGATD
jgi:heat shock protein HslJ